MLIIFGKGIKGVGEALNERRGLNIIVSWIQVYILHKNIKFTISVKIQN
jgi:hypothetical protein